MPDVFRALYVIVPDVARNGFGTLPALRTALSNRTIFANVAFALVLSVAITVGGCVVQNLILRTENTVIIIVVHIFIPREVALLRHRALIGQRRNSSTVEDLLADPRGFVAGIRRNDLHLRVMPGQSLEYRVKRDAVVDITGRDLRFQHVAALITDGMRFICKALFCARLCGRTPLSGSVVDSITLFSLGGSSSSSSFFSGFFPCAERSASISSSNCS